MCWKDVKNRGTGGASKSYGMPPIATLNILCNGLRHSDQLFDAHPGISSAR